MTLQVSEPQPYIIGAGGGGLGAGGGGGGGLGLKVVLLAIISMLATPNMPFPRVLVTYVVVPLSQALFTETASRVQGAGQG